MKSKFGKFAIDACGCTVLCRGARKSQIKKKNTLKSWVIKRNDIFFTKLDRSKNMSPCVPAYVPAVFKSYLFAKTLDPLFCLVTKSGLAYNAFK